MSASTSTSRYRPSPQSLASPMGFFEFLGALFYLVFIFPILVVFEVLRWFWQLITSSWFLFTLLLLGSVGLVALKYHNRVQSQAEYVMRCYVAPVWQETILPIWELFEIPYNLLICWWDAVNWFYFGYFTEVLIPGMLRCGFRNLFVKSAPVIRVFFQEFFVDYFATGGFLYGFYDATNLGIAMVDFWEAWVDIWCCLCMDLCVLFRCAPVPILFIVYPFLQVSGYFLQQEFWLAVGEAINVIAALIQVAVQLIIQIFTVGLTNVDPRPDFEIMMLHLCYFTSHFMRATENVIQCFWDGFVPWQFKWSGFLCIIDTLVCIVTDLITVVTRMIIHVDRIFLDIFTPDPGTMIGPRPGSLWHGSIKQVGIRFFNTFAPLSDPAFYYDVHVLNRTTAVECICTLVRRIICDPSDNSTACFSQGAATYLENFDFCCLTNTVIILVNDFTKGLWELFLNATDATTFFRWVDSNANYEILIGIDGDVVHVVSCILSALEFIPVVGFCLKHVIVSIIAFVTGQIQFAFRGVLSLVTLPYFLIVLGMNNLLLRPGELLDLYERPINLLIAPTATSALNCLCYIFNSIMIPPITTDSGGNFVPCGCQAVGFIPPPPLIGNKIEDAFDWSNSFLDHKFERGSALNKLTPILVYSKEKDIRGQNRSVINPIYLKERILDNLALYGADFVPSLARDVDAFIANKSQALLAKWDKIKDCQDKRAQSEELRVAHPWRYKYLLMKGQLPGHDDCKQYDEFLIPFGSRGPVDQIAYDREILEDGHYYQSSKDYMESTEGRNSSWFAKLPNQAVWEWDRMAMERYNNVSNITVSTTAATQMGCPGPNEPLLPCFDVCCITRASALLVGHIMLSVGRLVNALIQGNFQNPGWQYFTGVSCPACFEQDLVTLIRRAVGPLACGCQMFNLILPSSPMFPRPDLCCSITYLGDFVAGILQVIINGIKSLALDLPDPEYFTKGGFMNDANVLFDLTLRIVACLCNVVRYTFPIYQLTGGGFDPCCLGENIFIILVELQRLILQIIVNLALIVASPEAIQYWRDGGISRGYAILDNIGFVKQGDVVIDAIFGRPGGVCAPQERDQGVGGISMCVCQILSTIIPIRPSPGDPVSEPNNCPIFDICCPIRGISLFLGSWTKFQLRVLVSTWQSWDPVDYGRPPGNALPIAFLDFLFCNEENMDVEKGCGKLKPTLELFIGVIAGCPCQFGELADAWLTEVLPAHNFQCFCGRVDGFFTNIGGLIENITYSIVTLIRRIAQPSYWEFEQGGPSTNAIIDSWAYRFLGPTINSICNLIVSGLCVFNSILGLPCTEYQKRLLRSVIRWLLESILRSLAFIQGFILIFAEGVNSACPPPTPCPPDGQCPNGRLCTQGSMCSTPCPTGTAGATGISVAQLAQVWVSMFSYIFDLLIGDSSVLCSVVNPPVCPQSDPCCCYSPIGSYVYQPIGGIFVAGRQCAQCIDDNCTLLINSYPFPTCTFDPCDGVTTVNPPCDPNTKLLKKKPCVNAQLISCDANKLNGTLAPLDGIIIALLRYIRCMVAALFMTNLSQGGDGQSGLAVVFDAFISLLSFIWQIFTPIIRFLAALVLFIILLFGFLNGGCACHGGANGQYVQRGGLCYPCEEQHNIRFTWWTDNVKVHNPNWDGPKPGPDVTFPGNLCLAGYTISGGFFNKTNIKAVDDRMCIDLSLAQGPNGCMPLPNGTCGPIAMTPAEFPAKCQVCNVFGNNIGEVGNSIDCDLFGGYSCSLCGANPLVLCGVIQLWEAFADIFNAFIQVFTQAPINPTPPPGKKSVVPDAKPWHDNPTPRPGFRPSGTSYREFKKRVDYDLAGGNIYEGGNTITLMIAAAWDYDITDCPHDLRTCLCRNLPIPDKDCNIGTALEQRWLEKRDKKDADAMSGPVMNHMAQECANGKTRCDYLISSCGNMTWSQIPMGQQVHYINCVDKMIQGKRLHDVMPSFPANFYLTNTGPIDLAVNMHHAATHALKKDRDYAEHDRKEAAKKRARIDPEFVSRNEQARRDMMQRRQNILLDASKDPRWDNSMVLDFFLELDQYEYLIRSGIAARQIRDAIYNVRYGKVNIPMSAIWDAFKDQTYAASSQVYSAQLRKTIDDTYRGLGGSISAMHDFFLGRGPVQMWRDMRARLGTSPEHVASRKRAEAVRELTRAAFKEGALYKWWFSKDGHKSTGTYLDYANPLGVFVDHMVRNFRWHRENWQKMEANAFTIDLHMKDTFAKTVARRWEKKWTPQKLANWDSIARVFYRFAHGLFPDLVPEEKRGFIIDGNCFLVDGLVDEIIFLVTYCANDFMPNYPISKRIELRNSSAVWRWFDGMALRGEQEFGSPRKYIPEHQQRHLNARDMPSRRRSAEGNETEAEWQGSYAWLMHQGLNWVRPKIADLQWKNRRQEQMTVWRMLSKQQWERAISTAPFDTLSWFIRAIDSVFGINTELEIDNIVGQIEDFVNNDNLDYMAAPVGLKYWLLFWVRCQFKPLPGQLASNAALNLSCAAGIGLEATLGYVLVISIAVFVVGSIILPSTLLPLIGAGAFVFYIVLIPAVAWHYSPRCWLMSPALSIAGINGISVPLLPFPVAFPALPFCLLTEFRHLFNKYITTCYRVLWDTHLEFLFPPYMILTDACPTCPQRVGMANCGTDVGFDGVLSTLAFFLVQAWPGATDAVKTLASLTPCQPGSILNGFCGDAVRVFVQVSGLTGDQFKQHVWCSFLTAIVTIAVVAGVSVVFFSFMAMFIRLVLLFFGAVWAVIKASGITYFLPGGSSNLYDEWMGPLPEPEYSAEDAFTDTDGESFGSDSDDFDGDSGRATEFEPDNGSDIDFSAGQDAASNRNTEPSAPPSEAINTPIPALAPVVATSAAAPGSRNRNRGLVATASEGLIDWVGHKMKTLKKE